MNQELSYQEDKIKQTLSEMSGVFSEIQFLEMQPNATYGEKNLQLEEAFAHSFKKLFNLCLVYFETKGLLLYRNQFESEFLPLLTAKSDVIFEGKYDEESGEAYSIVISKVWEMLLPFPAFEYGDLFFRRVGMVFLENVLKNTGVILDSLKVIPDSENAVSSKIKIVLKAAFPEVKIPTEMFLKTATHYKPDIIIPELNTAIEYKFVTKDEKDLNTKVDEILVDVQGYDKHTTIMWFYAVFYIKHGICTKDRFDLIWEEKNFPKNWKGILVEGPIAKKSKKEAN